MLGERSFSAGTGNAAGTRRSRLTARKMLQLFLKLPCFFRELLEETCDLRPLKAYAGYLGADLTRLEKCGQAGRNSREKRFLLFLLERGFTGFGALPLLQHLPVADDIGRGIRLNIAE